MVNSKCQFVGVLFVIASCAVSARAQIGVRVSVKFILDENNNPPSGRWMDPATWEDEINIANAGHERFGRGFRYLGPDFDGNVSGASQYFIIAEDRRCTNGAGGLDGDGACRTDDDCDNNPPCNEGEADCENTCQDADRKCANGAGGLDGAGSCLTDDDCDNNPPCNSGEEDCERYCLKEGDWLEIDARNNPAQYHWRDDAINVYVTEVSSGTELDPKCNGWAQSPISAPPVEGAVRGIVVLCADVSGGPLLAHEFGHYFNLKHTWDNRDPFGDLVEDTPIDANPSSDCPASGAWATFVDNCVNGGTYDGICGSNEDCERKCCCKEANTRAKAAAESWPPEQILLMLKNLMSYHCDRTDDFTLSEGQLDWYADVAREFRAQVCTGVTCFVGGSPLWEPPLAEATYVPFAAVAEAIAAADPTGGDIVMIRAGSYNETLIIDTPVTLRATRGSVLIGD